MTMMIGVASILVVVGYSVVSQWRHCLQTRSPHFTRDQWLQVEWYDTNCSYMYPLANTT